MLDLSELHWIPVLGALVAHMVLGALWFGAFAKPWTALAHPGKTKEDLQAGPKWVYGLAALNGLVTALVLYGVLRATGSLSLGDALGVGALLWLGFVAMQYMTTYAFGARPWTLLAIDVGYPLVSILAQAAIFALWA